MKRMIPIDFDVECTYEDEERMLFAAGRKRLLHLVVYTPAARSITQYHLPYFSLVEPLCHIKTRRSANKVVVSPNNDRSMWDVQGDVKLLAFEGWPIKLIIEGANITLSELCFHRRLSRLAGKLKRARTDVIPSEKGYTLPYGQTPESHPVISDSERLVQAISFEAATNSGLHAEDLGLFSAYCSHVDFSRESKAGHIIEDARMNGVKAFARVSSGRMADILETLQSRFFAEAIWKPGWTIDDGLFVGALRTALSKLDEVQITQVTLMIGMHSAHVLSAFAAVTGIMTFDEYKEPICHGFQPDSEDEQSMRGSASYIELFGRLAAASGAQTKRSDSGSM
jgi:hypothetical protein